MTAPGNTPTVTTTGRTRWTWQWVPLVMLMLVVLEVVARIEDRIVYGIPFMSRVVSPNDLVWLHPQGARGRPNARYQQWRLNNLGFRGQDMSPAPQAGTVRVITVGASETFGLYESPEQEYTRQLEDSLRARTSTACGPDAPRIEVANAALPGMATPSMAVALDQVIRQAAPNVLVLYPSPGFYLNVRRPTATFGAPGADSTLPFANALRLRVASRAVRQARSLVSGALRAHLRRIVLARRVRQAHRTRFTAVPTDRLRQFDSDLRNAVGVAKSTGASVVLMGHANATMAPAFSDETLVEAWVYQFPRSTGEVLREFHERAFAVEREIALDSGMVFIDLPAALSGREKNAFADFVHFTDEGAAIVAGAIAEAVLPVLDCQSR